MHYRIQIPHTAPPASGFPLWVFLHGAFSLANQAEALFGDEADSHHAILFAPQATRPCGDGFCWSFAHDVHAIGQLLATVRTTYPIDPTRIALIGYSMGCTMGLWLLAQQPNIFASFAALGMGSAFEPWEHDDGGVDSQELRQSASRTQILLAVDQRDPGGNNDYVADNLARLQTLGFQVTTVRPNEGTHAITDPMRAAVLQSLSI
ncbi:MAG: esterase family protein [Chloroflexota bacterium]|nr:esterase family protein [Chloroflexota bacterium]